MFQFQNLGQENQRLKESFAYPIHNNEALTFLLPYQDNFITNRQAIVNDDLLFSCNFVSMCKVLWPCVQVNVATAAIVTFYSVVVGGKTALDRKSVV